MTKLKNISQKYLVKTTQLLVILIFCICSSFSLDETQSLTLVSNQQGAPDELTMTEMKSILKGERQRWNDGTKIMIALLKTNTSLGTTISKKVYNMSGDELNKYWLGLVFAGKAKAPQFFRSEGDLKDYVSQTKGAIGIVASENVDQNLRSINVEGASNF
ncbi:MAG: hypothetical protein COC01_10140 [Bacteroidetes bacterium]|nr:MAG: hypothetical protein COC01_10140 [Bacteroidota bacterium]